MSEGAHYVVMVRSRQTNGNEYAALRLLSVDTPASAHPLSETIAECYEVDPREPDNEVAARLYVRAVRQGERLEDKRRGTERL